MRQFGGKTLFLDRSDINTDEIIPAKYLTENTKMALQPHILEDLKLGGFNPKEITQKGVNVIVARGNFGCGSSREHAVWVFDVNDINMVVAESFARIFRQNMFNNGMLAIELDKQAIAELFDLGDEAMVKVDLKQNVLTAETAEHRKSFPFDLNPFDRELVLAGGWLEYADKNY
ncbi:MAG: 3-isopropylmalate dehydratase small subunit [Deltaproteobacteria bacterium]